METLCIVAQYYFGRALYYSQQEQQQGPAMPYAVGLIEASWGGTISEWCRFLLFANAKLILARGLFAACALSAERMKCCYCFQSKRGCH